MVNLTNNPSELTDSEYTPEEAALIMRLRVFVNLRWLAVLGVVVGLATIIISLIPILRDTFLEKRR